MPSQTHSMSSSSSIIVSALKRISFSKRNHETSSSTPSCEEVIKRIPLSPQTSILPFASELDVLLRIAEFVDNKLCTSPLHLHPSTPFQLDVAPPTTIKDITEFFIRLVKYANRFSKDVSRVDSAGVRALLTSIELLERGQCVLTRRTFHLYFIVAMLLSMKTMEDGHVPSSFWSVVGGVGEKELAHLEMHFCIRLKYRLFVSVDQFQARNKQFGSPFAEEERNHFL